eukprot:7378375-Prymnesium_polylepis.1
MTARFLCVGAYKRAWGRLRLRLSGFSHTVLVISPVRNGGLPYLVRPVSRDISPCSPAVNGLKHAVLQPSPRPPVAPPTVRPRWRYRPVKASISDLQNAIISALLELRSMGVGLTSDVVPAWSGASPRGRCVMKHTHATGHKS